MARSNKIENNEELVAGYQEVECFWNVLSSSYKDRNILETAIEKGCGFIVYIFLIAFI